MPDLSAADPNMPSQCQVRNSSSLERASAIPHHDADTKRTETGLCSGLAKHYIDDVRRNWSANSVVVAVVVVVSQVQLQPSIQLRMQLTHSLFRSTKTTVIHIRVTLMICMFS